MNFFDMNKVMIDLQNNMNANVDPNWIKKNHDWPLAITQELSEAIDSFPWKWWKNVDNDPNIDNLIVEIVDIWHFLLSMVIVDECYEEFDIMVENYITSRYMFDETPIDILKTAINSTTSDNTYIEMIDDLVYLIFKLMKYIGISYEDLYKFYLTKNVLNIFRQHNGYKEGNYIKTWNGKEDNVVAFNIAIEIEETESNKFSEELYIKLEKYYNDM